MKTVYEIAKLAGVSRRTLQYYDGIGLLPPARTSDAGYRLYDETVVKRLEHILYLKELGFTLKQIKEILDNPDYNMFEALKKHREVLILKKERISRIIHQLDQALKGEDQMNFKAFDISEIEKAKRTYGLEVKERWGGIKAYAQSLKKTQNYTDSDWQKIIDEENLILRALANNMDEPPESEIAYILVTRWQAHITKYY